MTGRNPSRAGRVARGAAFAALAAMSAGANAALFEASGNVQLDVVSVEGDVSLFAVASGDALFEMEGSFAAISTSPSGTADLVVGDSIVLDAATNGSPAAGAETNATAAASAEVSVMNNNAGAAAEVVFSLSYFASTLAEAARSEAFVELGVFADMLGEVATVSLFASDELAPVDDARDVIVFTVALVAGGDDFISLNLSAGGEAEARAVVLSEPPLALAATLLLLGLLGARIGRR